MSKIQQIIQNKPRLRIKVVNAIFVFYFFLIFEGAIRKWILPDFAQYIIFIRFMVVSWIYLLVWHSLINFIKPKLFLYFLIFLSLFSIPLTLVQLLIGNYEIKYLILIIWGWINYFFYIPLAFIIGYTLNIKDITNLIRVTLVISIATLILVIIQFYSLGSSPINVGFGSEPLQSFSGISIGGDKIRPMGFFTSSVGLQLFVASTFSMILITLVDKKIRDSGSYIYILLCLFSILIVSFITIQRGTLIHIFSVCFFIFIATLLNNKVSKLLFTIFIVFLFSAFFIFLLLPEVFEVFLDRILGTYESNSREYLAYGSLGLFGRITDEIFRFVTIIQHVPLSGFLLGLGTNAASQLPWVEYPDVWVSWVGFHGFAEDGLSRHIVDLGPFLGTAYIFYRFVILFWLFRKSLRDYFIYNNKNGLIFFGFLAPILILLQITGQATINGYAWFFIGVNLALLNKKI